MSSVFMYAFTLLTIGTVLIVLIDKFVLESRRKEQEEMSYQLAQLTERVDITALTAPKWVSWAKEYWYWLVLVYFIRAFGFESFSIPSSSMMPNLLVGEQIVVTKFSFGLRDPLFRHELLSLGSPERGDVIVFRTPEHPDTDYVKRVIGVPGDTLVYADKHVSITHCEKNGQCSAISHRMSENGKEFIDTDGTIMRGYDVSLGNAQFEVVLSDSKIAPENNVTVTIPSNRYFVMGDNRDNSRDSRSFGLVNANALVGKASARWLHIETTDTLLGHGINLNRVGRIK